MQFAEATLEILRKAGWSESYRAWIEKIEEQLLPLTLSDKAREFLSLYGNLTFLRKNPYQTSDVMCHTDAVEAARHLAQSRLADLEQEAGSKLSPIGEDGYGSFIVLMDADGYVLVTDESRCLREVEESGEAWLNSLRLGHNQPVPFVDIRKFLNPEG
jgi:hypothetical protein